MVRFARAEGSKGSNKRVLEDATPWSTMVAQMNKKNKTEIEYTEKTVNENKDQGDTTPSNTNQNPQTKSPIKKKQGDTTSNTKKNKQAKSSIKKKKEDTTSNTNKNKQAKSSIKKKQGDTTSDANNATQAKSSIKKKKKKKKKLASLLDLEGNSICEGDSSQILNSEERKIKDKKIDSNDKENSVLGDDSSHESETKQKKEKKKMKSVREAPDSVKIVVENGQKYKLHDSGKKTPWFDLPYEESDEMTRYEGFWVKPEMAAKLKELREALQETMDSDAVKKKMMKAKRKAHKELIRDLLEIQKSEYKEKNKTKEATATTENDRTTNKEEKIQSVLFGGYWVTTEGAERLKKLKAELRRKGVPQEQINATIKNERRKEEKFLRREVKRVCLRCRKRGHLVNECPEGGGPIAYEQNCICYACGSTEHKVQDCPQASEKTSFPHATCFICRRVGHISRQCPSNPRGLYPNGGSCRGCGSVDHLAANCVTLLLEKHETTIRADRIDNSAVEALDFNELEFAETPAPLTFTAREVKTVTF